VGVGVGGGELIFLRRFFCRKVLPWLVKNRPKWSNRGISERYCGIVIH